MRGRQDCCFHPGLPVSRRQAQPERTVDDCFFDYEDVLRGLIERTGSALQIESSIKLPPAIVFLKKSPEDLADYFHYISKGTAAY